MKNLVRLALIAIFIVAFTISSAIVGAAVKIFDGKGEWHTSDAENQQIAMARASQRARIDAQKKAGVYLKTFSRSVNLELVDDEISAVTNNIIEIVGDVHFDKKIIPISNNQTTILYTATLKAKIDPEGIYDFAKRNSQNKVTIVQQNTQLQDAIQKNDELSSSLTEQYNRATSQAEKDQIRKQMNDADRDFLANQKNKEGSKLYYAKNYNGALKLFDEALKLKPNWDLLYHNRGNCYAGLENYELAIQNYTKAIELNPNESMIYTCRGFAYIGLGQYEQAIQNCDKAIQLNANNDVAYNNRGWGYTKLYKYERAIQDFNKALQINPNNAYYYNGRGNAYNGLKQYQRAIQDFSKAIQINPDFGDAYVNRSWSYVNLDEKEQSRRDFVQGKRIEIKDYTREIEINQNNAVAYCNRGAAYFALGQYDLAIQDLNKSIQLNTDKKSPYYAMAHHFRGMCYKSLGDNAKAQADFAKVKEYMHK